MSEIREQLRSARTAYRGARYPGHLAVDLLGRPRRGIRPMFMFLGAIGAGAIAAATLLMCMTHPAAAPAAVTPAPRLPVVRGLDQLPPKLQFVLPSLEKLRGLPTFEYLSLVRPLNHLIPAAFREIFIGGGASDCVPHAQAEDNPGAEANA